MAINTKHSSFLLTALLVITSSIYTSEQTGSNLATLQAACSTRDFPTVAHYKARVAAALTSNTYTPDDLKTVHDNILKCRDCLVRLQSLRRAYMEAELCVPIQGRPPLMSPQQVAGKPCLNGNDQNKLACYNAVLGLFK